ncbi:hypothetical protein F53441_3150 [Fusarium austroafricanum]|uniref:Secreted protein n=1 Tax=Fusarium austroafricanum TaxID=2364996 RepID=A0A8H4NX06_9HYPO|nr:hypothetical protein F53441_3150 [Fusarium austroafricanum]
MIALSLVRAIVVMTFILPSAIQAAPCGVLKPSVSDHTHNPTTGIFLQHTQFRNSAPHASETSHLVKNMVCEEVGESRKENKNKIGEINSREVRHESLLLSSSRKWEEEKNAFKEIIIIDETTLKLDGKTAANERRYDREEKIPGRPALHHEQKGTRRET